MPHDHADHADDHGHGGGHGHHHHHVPADAGDKTMAVAVGVNLLLTVAEIIGGILSGSVALIADAIHNLSDAAALVIAWAARKIARRPTDPEMTFGYKRAELVAALINYTTLIVIGLWLVWEAVDRFFNPREIEGGMVIAIAALALVVDALTALLMYRLSKESLNIRAAFLHNLADAFGSIAVIFVGVVVLLYDWRLADPLVTLGLAVYILWMSFSEIRAVIRILMLGSPPGIEPKEVLAAMEGLEAVENVHHLHLWQISEHVTSLEAHVVTTAASLDEVQSVKAALRAMLAERYGIGHVTLDTEARGEDCADRPRAIGGRG